eukprot:361875-Chlamydomonas_euryale.AAC.16
MAIRGVTSWHAADSGRSDGSCVQATWMAQGGVGSCRQARWMVQADQMDGTEWQYPWNLVVHFGQGLTPEAALAGGDANLGCDSQRQPA